MPTMPDVGKGRALLACVLSVVLGMTLSAALTGPALAGSPTEYDPACPPAAAPAPESDPIRIMLTGDSITNGTSGDYTWRYFFARYLQSAGENVDFVGPWSDLIDYTTFAWGHHEYAECGFDQDHFARGGSQLAEQLQPTPYSPTGESAIRWATSYYDPDVVVEFFGYNDLTRPRVRSDPSSAPYSVAELLANAKRFVDEVRAAKPTATIVMVNLAVAAIPDGPAENQRLVELAPTYNAQLAQSVSEWTTQESRVVLGDAARYWRGYDDTYDGAHPTAQGEVHLAAGIARSVSQELGIGADPPLPLPVVPLGPRGVPSLAGSVGDGWVRLSWKIVPGATRMLVYCRGAGSTEWNRLPDVARTIDGSGNSVLLRTCKTATPPAIDPPLTDGRTYQFQIRAAKGSAVATDIVSNTVTLTQPGLAPVTMPAVSDLAVTPAYHALEVSWSPVDGAVDYVVEWRRRGTTAYQSVTSASPHRLLTGLVAGQGYDVRVRPRGYNATGPYAGPIAAVAAGVVCAAPIKPTLRRATGHRIRAYWHTVAGATRYEVQYRSSSGNWKRMGFTTGTSLTSPELVAGRTYLVRVRAWHQLVAGGLSPTSSITAG